MIAISHHEGISLDYWVDYNRSKRNIYFVKYIEFPTFHINLQLMQQMSIFKNIFYITKFASYFQNINESFFFIHMLYKTHSECKLLAGINIIRYIWTDITTINRIMRLFFRRNIQNESVINSAISI